MTAKSNKTAKVAPAKVAKTAKAAAQLPAQLPAPQLPAQPVKMISTAAAAYHARKDAGVCVKCGQPLAEGSKLLCVKHLEYHNKWHADRKAKIDAAMALLAKQTAPIAQTQVAETVAAAPTAPVKPAVKAAKSKDLAALKATQPVAKPAAKSTKKSSKK
jgi:hypothetical protein